MDRCKAQRVETTKPDLHILSSVCSGVPFSSEGPRNETSVNFFILIVIRHRQSNVRVAIACGSNKLKDYFVASNFGEVIRTPSRVPVMFVYLYLINSYITVNVNLNKHVNNTR